MPVQKIAISANFTAEPVSRSITTTLEKLGVEHEVTFAPYNQVFQELLNPASLFRTNTSGVNVLLIRVQDLIDGKEHDFKYGSKELEAIKANAEELGTVLGNAADFQVPLFIFLCPASASVLEDPVVAPEISAVERRLVEVTGDVGNAFVFANDHLVDRYSIASYDNAKANYLGHIPYTDEFFAALGVEIVRSLDALLRKPYKVLVLDCDNTLWGGVCGEDGTQGIQFRDAHIFLQDFAVKQSSAGMLVCLCSKNNEPDVWEVFDQRTEMPLKRDHLVTSRINWAPKSANLKSLTHELNLGLDSFVFVDDDSAVCAEVRANCPEVLTVQVPPASESLPKLFEHLWVFDRLKVTQEDRERAASYKNQVKRSQLEAKSSNLASFLESLELVCEISDIHPEQVARVSQLSMRTNQFNSTTIRRSESQVQKLMDDPRAGIKVVNVKDRFGDYGLVGVVVYEETDESIIVDSFMLSCRALGRGVEHTVLRAVGVLGANAGKHQIDIKFTPTTKNQPFLNFLSEIGEGHEIEENGERFYRVPVEKAANVQPGETKSSTPEPVKTIEGDQVSAPASGRFKPEVYVEIARSLSEGPPYFNVVPVRRVDRSSLSSDFLKPRTETEAALQHIWQKLFHLSGVGVADDFFELGGDSLLAVSLFVEIEEKFGMVLPLSALVGVPTIGSLARLIDEGSTLLQWKYLVPIKTAGAEAPLFCFHAAGGNVLFYRDLANGLGDEQPVYGVQARGVADKSETAHDRIEDMAREYLAEIRQLQPRGPYKLCGSSFGGLVAFEAARQLGAAGEKVEILGLFDTYAPGFLAGADAANSNSIVKGALLRVASLLRQIGEIPTLRERWGFLVSKAKKLRMKVKRNAAWKKNQFDLQYAKATGKELPADIQRNHKAIQTALESYRPSGYPGRMLLFRANEQPKDLPPDMNLGWGKFVRHEIVIREVKGTHGALTVYPYAADLAEKFKPFLATAKAE